MTDAVKLSPADAERFALAGDAVFTMHNPITDARFTYRVQRAKGDEQDRPWFVKVLTGPDNTHDFQFVGSIFPDSEEGFVYRHSFRKSRIGEDAPSVMGIRWLVRRLGALVRLRAYDQADLFAKGEAEPKIAAELARLGRLDFYHEGRCGRCARRLTVPESILNGLGPECLEKVGRPNILNLIARLP